MKKFIIFAIGFYQMFLSLILKNVLGVKSFCRFSPSCSEYTKRSIEKYGLFKGGQKAMARVLSCQPFSKK